MKKQYSSHIENLESRQLLNADALPAECPQLIIPDCDGEVEAAKEALLKEFAEETQQYRNEIEILQTKVTFLELENQRLAQPWLEWAGDKWNEGVDKVKETWAKANSHDIGAAVGSTLAKAGMNALLPAAGLIGLSASNTMAGKHAIIAGTVMGAVAIKTSINNQEGNIATIIEETAYPAAAVALYKYGPGSFKWTQDKVKFGAAAVKTGWEVSKAWVKNHTPSLPSWLSFGKVAEKAMEVAKKGPPTQGLTDINGTPVGVPPSVAEGFTSISS